MQSHYKHYKPSPAHHSAQRYNPGRRTMGTTMGGWAKTGEAKWRATFLRQTAKPSSALPLTASLAAPAFCRLMSDLPDPGMQRYDGGPVFDFGSPMRASDMAFSPLRPGADPAASPFTFMNQLSPLLKLHSAPASAFASAFPGVYSPGLTPLLDQSNRLSSPTPGSAFPYSAGLASVSPLSPSRQYSIGRLNSSRKIEFFDNADPAAGSLAPRWTAPSLTSGAVQSGASSAAVPVAAPAGAPGVRPAAPFEGLVKGSEDSSFHGHKQEVCAGRVDVGGVGNPPVSALPTFVESVPSDDEALLNEASACASAAVSAPSLLLRLQPQAASDARLRAPAKPRAAKRLDSAAAAAPAPALAACIPAPAMLSPAPQAPPRNYSTPTNRPQASNDITPPTQTQPPPKKFVPCNCKKSKCLKLYCECFASGRLCTEQCNCCGCCNSNVGDPLRASAVQNTLDRNPKAFAPKIPNNAVAQEVKEVLGTAHSKGCHCKKSGCLKKYCECFQAGITCGNNCKCLDCQNIDGCAHLVAARRAKKGGNRRPFPASSGRAHDGGVGAAGVGAGYGASGSKGAGGGSEGSPVGLLGDSDANAQTRTSTRRTSARARTHKRSYAHLDEGTDDDDEAAEEEEAAAGDSEDEVWDNITSAGSYGRGGGRDRPPAASPPMAVRAFRASSATGAPPRGSSSAARVQAGGLKHVEQAYQGRSGHSRAPQPYSYPCTADGSVGDDTTDALGEHELAVTILNTSTVVPSNTPSALELAMAMPLPLSVLPLRRWQLTLAVPSRLPAHLTFGAHNPSVSDLLVTTVLSYLANDDIYNSSLVCVAWAALSMDSQLWDWDAVEAQEDAVMGASAGAAPLRDSFESMLPLTPQRPQRAEYVTGIPFLYGTDDDLPLRGPSSPPLRVQSHRDVLQYPSPLTPRRSSSGSDAVRMSLMSPLLSMASMSPARSPHHPVAVEDEHHRGLPSKSKRHDSRRKRR